MNEKPPPILCWARFAWPIGCNQFPQLTGPGYSVYSSNWGSQRPKSPLTDLHFHVQILLTSTLITHLVFLCTKVLMINFPWSTFCSSDAVILRRAGVPQSVITNDHFLLCLLGQPTLPVSHRKLDLLFSQHLLSGFLVPGTVLGTKDKAVNKTKIPQSWNVHSSKDREI